MAQVYNDKI